MPAAGPDILQPTPPETAFPAWPWLTILIQPRATIQAIVDSDPERHVALLALLYGVINFLSDAADTSLGEQMPLPMLLVLGSLLGGVGGLIGLYAGGAILTYTGRRLGGQAAPAEVRAAMAWSVVPVVAAGFFLPAMLLLYGGELFSQVAPRMDARPLPYLGYALFTSVMTVWWWFLFWKCYAQVQRFSLPRALIAILAPGLIVFLLIACLVLLYALWIARADLA